MSRGPRKTIEDKIRDKEELIQGLKTRIQSENRELEALRQEKRAKEMEAIAGLLEESGVTVEQAREILEQHIAQENENADEADCA
ncbi:MAG: hypothetical protein NC254_11640 [bacterium]|nr:hypothetical protein [bacterium]